MIETALIVLCALMLLAIIFLFKQGLAESKARMVAEENAKYWKTIAEDNGKGKSKYYVGLRECMEEAQKLVAFIGDRYHGAL